MAIGAFPLAKLAVLLVKQISKPIANACKVRAKNSPFFRTYVCMPPAQFYNWCEVKAKMWILNLGKPVNIPVLSQKMAIELGANLLGETVIFVIGAGLLTFEYNRQSNKESAKEAKREEEIHHITRTITDLYFTVQQQQTQLREMERMVYSITGKLPPSPPPVSEQKPPPEPPKAPSNSSGTNNPVVLKTAHPHHSNLPYPDQGLVLRSLNYIQMDVLSSSVFARHDPRVTQTTDEEPIRQIKREPGLLTNTINELENNFRSLF